MPSHDVGYASCAYASLMTSGAITRAPFVAVSVVDRLVDASRPIYKASV